MKLQKDLIETVIDKQFTGLSIIDRNGKVRYANKKLCDILNLPAEELIGKSVLDLKGRFIDESGMPFENDELPFFKMKNSNEKFLNKKLMTEYKKGERKHLILSGFPLMGEDQSFDGMLCLIDDLSMVKKAVEVEEKLRKRYEKIAENSYDIILIITKNLVVDYYNTNPISNILGYSEEEIPSLKVDELVHPEDYMLVMEAFQRGFKEGNARIVGRVKNKQGKFVYLEAKGKTFLNESGKERLLINIRDIDEKIKEFQKTKKISEDYQRLFDTIAQGIVYHSRQGDIISANPAASKILGYDLQELSGKHSEDPEWGAIHEDGSEFPGSEHPSMVALRTGKPVSDVIMGVYNPQKKVYVWIKVNAIPLFLPGEKEPYQVYTSFEDITLLKQNEEKFKSLALNANEGIIIIDQQGIIRFWNRTAEKIFKFNKSEVIGKKINETIMPPEFRTVFLRAKKKFNRTGESSVINDIMQTQGIRKDGTRICIELSHSELIIEGKWHAMAIVRDITKRLEIERKIKESERNFRTLLDTAPDIIFTVDRDLKITYINKVPEGHDKEESIGKNTLDYVDMNFRDDVEKKIMRVFETGKTDYYETEARGPHNSISYYSTRIAPIIENEKISQVLFITRDMTERRRMEIALTTSEKKYRKLFNSVPYSILLADLRGNLIDFNDATEKIFGYKREEMIGKPFFKTQVFNEYSLKEIVTNFKKFLKTGKSELSEYLIKKKSGEEAWVSVETTIISLDDRKMIQSIVYDITKRKEFEQGLIKLNKLRSELFKRISHQLKTPLSAVIGYADLTLKTGEDNLKDVQKNFLEEIKNAGKRLESDINEILKLTRLTSDSIKITKNRCNIIKLIEHVISELKSQILLKNHKITRDFPKEIILKIDKERIQDVINNLIENAIKYTPPSGSIIIKAGKKGESFRFSVKDNGVGLLEEEIERLFVEFERIKQDDELEGISKEGTGLGLYISKRIIENHGGEIWVESEGRNKGSTFIFRIPLK